MMKKIIAVATFLLCTTAAQAGIVMGGTRVIYQEGKREAALSGAVVGGKLRGKR